MRTTSTFRPARRSRLGIAGLAVLLAAGLGACGSSTKVSTPSTTAATGGASTAAYTSCLVSHGIPSSAAGQLASGGGRRAFGGGGGGPEGGGSAPSLPAGVTTSSLRTALQACRSENPHRGGFGGGGFNSAALDAYRNCLQIHGVTLPSRPGAGSTTSTTAAGSASTTAGSTPPGSGGPGGRGLGGLDTSNPTVQAALQACASLRPTRSGTTTTTAG